MRSDQFRLLIESEFPFPIAYAFRRTIEEKESCEALCSLLVAVLEFAGHVLVSDYLAQEDRDAEIDAELGRLIKAPPSAGWWHGMSLRIARHFAGRSRSPFLGELAALAERSAVKELEGLIESRNSWAHHRSQFSPGNFRRRFFKVLERIVGIHKYTLFCPQNGKLRDGVHTYETTLLSGDNPLFGEIECRSDLALETGTVLLYSRGSRQLLPLSPFILSSTCDECGEKHYWRYDRPGNRKIVYTSVRGGHELSSAEAYLRFAQIIEHPRTVRLSPRFFSIPGGFSGMPRTLTKGDRVGPYEVEELIKLGGMAQIYRVVDTRTRRGYALKLLPVELSRDPVLLCRFEEEAVILRRLRHSAIVGLHDLGEDFGDRYLVLDLAVGGTIAGQRCRDLADLEKPIPEEAVIAIGKQLCDGLQYVHGQGVVHRDLKPSNVLVSGDRVVVTDFGIARARGDQKITLTGMPVGTPEYMAPEQIRDEEVDHRADIYALGCVLYELATGRPPYHADTPLTTALHHLQARPPRIKDLNPRISDGLAGIILKAIQKRVDLRYQTMQELHDHLSRVNEAPAGPQVIPGEEAPYDALEKLRREEKRKYRRRVLLVVGFCLLALVAAMFGTSAYREWNVRGLIERGREAWLRGPQHWPLACDGLRELYLYAPTHPKVGELLREISERGTLVIRTVPSGASLELTPEPEEGQKLGLSLEPHLLSQAVSFQSGERIALAPGHYRVVARFGSASLAFPVFVGQVAYVDAGKTWEARGRVLPEDVGLWTPVRQPDATRFALAEEQVIDDLLLPASSPEGTVYVPPGPFWCAEPGNLTEGEDMVGPPTNPQFVAKGVTQFALRPAYLAKGFFIGVDEVSVAEFSDWFRRFGRDACRWRVVVLAAEFLRESREVPLERLQASWRQDIERTKEQLAKAREEGLELADVSLSKGDAASTREGLCLAKAECDEFGWLRYEARLRKSLEAQSRGDASLPVMDVVSEVALAYSRTQRRAMTKGFVTWVAEELDKTAGLVNRLERCLGDCRDAPGEHVAASDPRFRFSLPQRGRSLASFSEGPLLGAYVEWLFYRNRFSGRAPVKAAVAWARENKNSLPPALRDEVDAIAQRLSDPYLNLHADENSKCRDLLWSYLQGVSAAIAEQEGSKSTDPPRELDLENGALQMWLEDALSVEKERLVKLAGVRTGVAGLTPDALHEMEIPWDLRVEFGAATGWNLPSLAQWERAARGADSRRYPWGSQASLGVATTGPEREGPRSPTTNRLGGDVSPYGVWCLAGNMSEWILPPRQFRDMGYDFLKGGNWWHKSVYASVGCVLAVRSGYRGPYAGMRIVRECSRTD